MFVHLEVENTLVLPLNQVVFEIFRFFERAEKSQVTV